MCAPAAPAGLMVASSAAAPALAAAGPGLMFASAPAAAAAGSVGFAPLGASFMSAAPSVSGLGGLTSLLSNAADVVGVVSPLASAFSGLQGAGQLEEMGQVQADAQRIAMNQQILDQQRIELERREKANAEIASLVAGGQPGQSLTALTRKKLEDSDRSRQFSETAIGTIGVTGRARIAATQAKTKTAVDAALGDAGLGAGRAVGFLAERFGT
jgi:hypothetical protein